VRSLAYATLRVGTGRNSQRQAKPEGMPKKASGTRFTSAIPGHGLHRK
jgi:hypothetical protein